MGAGAVGRGGGGGLDISNLVKPALARGDLQCIGATTLDEHRKYIERDTALERRFQPVTIGEPTPEDTVEILQGLKDRYERHHHCLYDHDAIEACAKLSERYVVVTRGGGGMRVDVWGWMHEGGIVAHTHGNILLCIYLTTHHPCHFTGCRYIADRFLPDKAIDIMDEAGSRARITAYFARASNGQDGAMDPIAWEELKQVMDAKDEAIKDGLFEEAILLRSRENDLKARLAGPADAAPVIPVVTTSDIENIVSAWTGVMLCCVGWVGEIVCVFTRG